MKRRTLSVLLAAAVFFPACDFLGDKVGDGTVSSVCMEDVDFGTYFTGERLRIDLVLAGDAGAQDAYVNRMFREPEWSGSPASLIDRFGYGQYYLEAFSGGDLIYSKGFSTLFDEWRTTPQARRVKMSMGHSIWMPFPKDSVHVVVYQRDDKTWKFMPMLELDVDPTDRHIEPSVNDYRVSCLQYSGESSHKVDLVFVGEGYATGEMGKLRGDALRFTSYLFSMEPYDSRRDDFNVWLVETPSVDSGVDIPQEGVWRNTVLDSGYDTFYEDRYLTVWDQTKIADLVSGSAFDTVFVIANDMKYGGGGIYNSYALGSSDNKLSEPVFIHEFGHSFAGLGDEYYDSSVAYENFYPAGVEPWEPNITTKVNFASKWRDMMGQDGVDLYEGAGYMAEGCWRPYKECRMFNNTAPGFCPVCRRAIDRMIDYYTR